MQTETTLLVQELSDPQNDSSETSDQWEVDRLLSINKVCKDFSLLERNGLFA